MVEARKPSLLAVEVAGLRPRTTMLDVYLASTLREVVATIRLVCIDLLAVGLENPKLDVWEMMRRVLAAWPHQRWLLVSRRVTAKEEVQARSLGALLVLNQVPDEVWLADFVASLRRRDLSNDVRSLAAAGAMTRRVDGVAVHAKAV